MSIQPTSKFTHLYLDDLQKELEHIVTVIKLGGSIRRVIIKQLIKEVYDKYRVPCKFTTSRLAIRTDTLVNVHLVFDYKGYVMGSMVWKP